METAITNQQPFNLAHRRYRNRLPTYHRNNPYIGGDHADSA